MADVHEITKGENLAARAVAEQAAQRLWPGEATAVVPLAGGLTNDVFRVTSATQDAALQVQMDSGQSARLQIDREIQLVATRHAAAIGIGPAVLSHTAEPPVLVTAFVDGATFSEREPDDATLARAARTVAVLHGSAFDPVWSEHVTDVPAGILTWAEPSRSTFPAAAEAIATALAIAAEAAPLLPRERHVPSHNDLMPGNLLDDGVTTWLIDWEFCGLNVPEHDLANFIRLNALDERRAAVFLDAYGPLDDVRRAAITVCRVLAQLWEAAYVLKCGTVGFLEIDHAAFFAESVADAAQRSAEPAYRDAIALLAARAG